MRTFRWLASLLPSLLAVAAFPLVSAAVDTQRNEVDPHGFSRVLERIAEHARNDDWRRGGWSDPTIEKWLADSVAVVGRAAEKPELKLPVKFADVRPLDAGDRLRVIRGGGLVIGKDINLGRATGMVILADGGVDVGFADGCVIIARGPITIAHCNNSVVASGTLVEISHDGNGLGGMPSGSVVLSRGPIDISHATGTMLFAHDGATISHAQRATFLDTAVQASHRNDSRDAKLPAEFRLEPRKKHVLETQIAVLGSVEPKGIVIRFDKKRYVVDLNLPILDESGEPVAALKDWRVVHVGDAWAVLSDSFVELPLQLPQ